MLIDILQENLDLIAENVRLQKEVEKFEMRAKNAYAAKKKAKESQERAIKNLNRVQIEHQKTRKHLRMTLDLNAELENKVYFHDDQKISLDEALVLARIMSESEDEARYGFDRWIEWLKVHRSTRIPRPAEMAAELKEMT